MARRGKGEGSIRERADGKWEARISVRGADGKRKSISRYFERRVMAIDGLKELRKEFAIAGNTETKKWSEFRAEWLSWVKQQTTPATFAVYSAAVKHIDPLAIPDSMRLHEIKIATVDRLMRLYAETDLGNAVLKAQPNKARSALIILRRMLNYAVRKQYLTANVAMAADAPKARPARRQPILEVKQAKRLLAEAKKFDGGKYYELVSLALYTAARQGELFALPWSAFDASRKTLRIDYTLSEDHEGNLTRNAPKTTAANRTLELPPTVVQELLAKKKRDRPKPDDFIFFTVDRDGEKVPLRKSNFRRRVWLPLTAKAKIPATFTFHGLRHVSNSYQIAKDGNIAAAQARLGHASARMTIETYSHVLPGHHRAVADAMDGLFDE